MNGRIYDPQLGRMLSADLVVQAPMSLQSYNRYSYVMNNPLTLVDPSGFTAWEKTQGLVGGFLEANAVPDFLNPFSASPTEAPDVTRGRAAGNVLALLQGGAETTGGGSAATGGTLVTVGSGGLLSEVSVPVAVGGAIVATHGTLVTVNSLGHLKTNLERIKENQVSAGSDKGKVDSKNAPSTDAKKTETQTPQERGRESEKRVLNDMGETKNTEKVSTSQGDTIPDFQNTKQVGEIKDTKTVSNTSQIRAQKEAATTTGREHVIVTGENTRVSENAAKGSTIIRRKDLGPVE